MVLSNKEMNYICLAKAEAEKSKVLHQHGCIAVVNGKIMAKGHNDTQRTTSRDNFIKNTNQIQFNFFLKKRITLFILR